MGDLFHQTNAQQSATNQQIGISTRDVGGSVITIGHGAASSGGTINVQSLDPAALNVAAGAVHDALVANEATSTAAFESFQKALTITGETAQSSLQLAASGAGSGQTLTQPSLASDLGVNPSTLIWVAGAVVMAVLVIGKFR